MRASGAAETRHRGRICSPAFSDSRNAVPAPAMATGNRLPKQVLSLYRQLLRASKDKPGFAGRIREEFRRNTGIPPRDALRIEFLLRRGQRQLEQLRAATTKRLGAFGSAPE